MKPQITVRLQREAFDAAAESDKLTHGRTDVGAVVSFTGICRGSEEGEPIAALTLEHYPGMAESEIERHVSEACARWPLMGATVIHRYGRIPPGEPIVLVINRSSHRLEAFSRIPDGFFKNAGAVLETGRNRAREKLGGREGDG